MSREMFYGQIDKMIERGEGAILNAGQKQARRGETVGWAGCLDMRFSYEDLVIAACFPSSPHLQEMQIAECRGVEVSICEVGVSGVDSNAGKY